MVDAALSHSASELAAGSLEELAHFRRWSVFLPRTASHDMERSAVYVRARHTGNPKFFEEMRERLQKLLLDRDLLAATGSGHGGDRAVAEAVGDVLKAQHVALGFACNRQFHKALALGELCVELADLLASACHGNPNILFWQVLCRANLGDSYVRFKKTVEAKIVLRQGLELVDGGSGGSRDRVVAGACYAHLAAITLEADDVDEAMRLQDLQIDVFERFIWDLPDTPEDREVTSSVLATAYLWRGRCEMVQSRHDGALAWFGRAREVAEKHADLGHDGGALLGQIAAETECAQQLQAAP